MSETVPNILEIRKATVYRGERRALSNLSLKIPLGCQTAILGPNGAGKSTFLKLLAGEVHPVAEAGSSVHLFGRDCWNVWDLRAQMGIVSHDLQHEYLGQVSGMKVILSGYYASNGTYSHQGFNYEQLSRASHVTEELGVAPLNDRRFAEMSTGEQRRFLLGRVLVHDPQVLILDEPTSGLDPHACFQYLDILRTLIRKGKTVLLVTHHIHEIPPEVSRVVLLKQGRVVADGAKSGVLTSERLTSLFETQIELVQANGWYQALPGK